RPRTRGRRAAAAGHARDPRARPARRAARHDPALPDLLGDRRLRPEGAARRDRRGEAVVTQLQGQTVVVIGGSAGIGLETARLARSEGAEVVLAARDPERLERAAEEVGARSTAAFDATDFDRLRQFFDGLPTPIDHVLVTGPGPYYAPLAEFDFDKARHDVEAHLFLPMQVAQNATGKVRPGGTLLFMGGTGGPRPGGGPSPVP